MAGDDEDLHRYLDAIEAGATTRAEIMDAAGLTAKAFRNTRRPSMKRTAALLALGASATLVAPSQMGDGYTISCDDHVANIGDLCRGAGRSACTTDKRA